MQQIELPLSGYIGLTQKHISVTKGSEESPAQVHKQSLNLCGTVFLSTSLSLCACAFFSFARRQLRLVASVLRH